MSPCSKDAPTRAFAGAAKKVGIRGNLHILRHTFCSHLLMHRVSLRTAQALAGHSNFAITEQYAHFATQDKTEVADKIRL
nr:MULTISPECIES: tyrosine-type recombinase/integrase [unclassified Rudaea]